MSDYVALVCADRVHAASLQEWAQAQPEGMTLLFPSAVVLGAVRYGQVIVSRRFLDRVRDATVDDARWLTEWLWIDVRERMRGGADMEFEPAPERVSVP